MRKIKLFVLFKRHLLESGVKASHIIEIQLDDRENKNLRNPDKSLAFIKKKVKLAQRSTRTEQTDSQFQQYYLLIDEVQMIAEFEDVLNSCLHIENLDTYVTGSNSKFLSKDVITEFRYPKNLFKELYVKDILEHNRVQNDAGLERLLDIVSSGVGSLTSLKKLENTFKSDESVTLSVNTISRYMKMLEDAYMLVRVERYDVKGRKYIGTQQKCYFVDLGLRSALWYQKISFTLI